MNRAYWALPGVKGTVWEHYMLVASQWPTVPLPAGPDNDGRFFPGLAVNPDTPRENYQSADAAAESKENLVNTTMETYLQDAPSSCMSCHAKVANARGRDFAGISPACLSPPPGMPCRRAKSRLARREQTKTSAGRHSVIGESPAR